MVDNADPSILADVGSHNGLRHHLVRIAQAAPGTTYAFDARRMLYLATSQGRRAATVKKDNASVLVVALVGMRMCVM